MNQEEPKSQVETLVRFSKKIQPEFLPWANQRRLESFINILKLIYQKFHNNYCIIQGN